MVPQLMCGNSLSTILLIQLAIVHVLAATLQLDYVHLIANLLSGQIGLPGKFKVEPIRLSSIIEVSVDIFRFSIPFWRIFLAIMLLHDIKVF